VVEDILPLDEKQSKMLLEENKHLHETLFAFENQIEQIGKQIVDIRQLTEQMAEHVETEAETLEHIFEQATVARSYIMRGNLNLQMLKADSKDLRLFLVTLLIFLSFALLFLHWINE